MKRLILILIAITLSCFGGYCEDYDSSTGGVKVELSVDDVKKLNEVMITNKLLEEQNKLYKKLNDNYEFMVDSLYSDNKLLQCDVDEAKNDAAKQKEYKHFWLGTTCSFVVTTILLIIF